MDNVIAAILGACVGGGIAYFASIRMLKLQEFNRAAATFRSEFVEALLTLEGYTQHPEDVDEVQFLEFLKGSRPDLERARIRFRPYLKKSDKQAFEKAWQDYCYPVVGKQEQQPGPFYEYQTDLGMVKAAGVAIEKLNGLLRFARPR